MKQEKTMDKLDDKIEENASNTIPNLSAQQLADILAKKGQMFNPFSSSLANYNYVDDYLYVSASSIFAMGSLLPSFIRPVPQTLSVQLAYQLRFYLPNGEIFLKKGDKSGSIGVVGFKNENNNEPKKQFQTQNFDFSGINEDSEIVVYDSYLKDTQGNLILKDDTNTFLNKSLATNTNLMYYHLVFYTIILKSLNTNDFLNEKIKIIDNNTDLASFYFMLDPRKQEDRLTNTSVLAFLKDQDDLKWFNRLQETILKYNTNLAKITQKQHYKNKPIFIWMISNCKFVFKIKENGFLASILTKALIDVLDKVQAEKEWANDKTWIEFLKNNEKINSKIKDVNAYVLNKYEEYKNKNNKLIEEINKQDKKLGLELKTQFNNVLKILDEKLINKTKRVLN